MKRGYALLICLLLIALAACAKPGPRIDGDRLILPAGCELAQPSAIGSDGPYYRFDGQYPQQWPKELTLPADSFLAGAAQIQRQEGYTNVQALVKLSGAQVLQHFKDYAAQHGGCEEQPRNINGRKSTMLWLQVAAHDPGSKVDTCYIGVTGYADLPGWCFYYINTNEFD